MSVGNRVAYQRRGFICGLGEIAAIESDHVAIIDECGLCVWWPIAGVMVLS